LVAVEVEEVVAVMVVMAQTQHLVD